MIGEISSSGDMLNCLTFMPSITEIVLCATLVTSIGPSERLGFFAVYSYVIFWFDKEVSQRGEFTFSAILI